MGLRYKLPHGNISTMMYKYRYMRFELLYECNEELLFRLIIQNKLIDINERVHQMVKTFEKRI